MLPVAWMRLSPLPAVSVASSSSRRCAETKARASKLTSRVAMRRDSAKISVAFAVNATLVPLGAGVTRSVRLGSRANGRAPAAACSASIDGPFSSTVNAPGLLASVTTRPAKAERRPAARTSRRGSVQVALFAARTPSPARAMGVACQASCLPGLARPFKSKVARVSAFELKATAALPPATTRAAWSLAPKRKESAPAGAILTLPR